MATLTIRKLDDHLKQALRQRAAANRHSMEEEARVIMAEALESYVPNNLPEGMLLGDAIQQLFKDIDTEGWIVERQGNEGREVPDFSKWPD